MRPLVEPAVIVGPAPVGPAPHAEPAPAPAPAPAPEPAPAPAPAPAQNGPSVGSIASILAQDLVNAIVVPAVPTPAPAPAPAPAVVVAPAAVSTARPAACAAIDLGWVMDAVLAGRPPDLFTARGLDLPPASGFGSQSTQLRALIAELGLHDADPSAVCTPLESGTAAVTEATAWETQLVAALQAGGSVIVRAYGTGRMLSRLTHGGFDTARFTGAEGAAVLDGLHALTTALPPHCGWGVAGSVQRWAALTSAPAGADELLATQGELWRAVLAGEKLATELLTPADYINAAQALGGRIRGVAAGALRELWLLVLVIVLLFAGGIVLLALAPRHAGTTVAGLSGVLSAVGLTWKGLGGTVRRLITDLETPLWGAELDGAVTSAMTRLPDSGRR